MNPTHLRPARRISLVVAAISMVAFFSFSASPALAADAPWATPVTVGDAYGDATATAVAPDGTITTVTETALGIVAMTSTDAGATWQTPVFLGSGGDYAFRPAVGVTSSGLLAAAWVEDTAGSRSIYVVISADSGATWSSPLLLPATSLDVDDPVIASSSASGFTIAFNQDYFDKYASSSFDGGATFDAPQNLTTAMNSYGSTSLVTTGAGTILAFYQEFDGLSAQYSEKSRTSTDGGASWGATVPVSGDWSGSLGNSVFLGLTSPSTGTAVAVWSHGVSGGGDGLFASTTSDDGATWGAPITVFSPAGYLRNFTVESVDSTSAGIVWYYESGSKARLKYATLAVGASSVSTPVLINPKLTTRYDRLPSFSTSGTTRVVSWYKEGSTSATDGYQVSASCDSGATWTRPVTLALGSDISSADAVTVVSGTTFSGIWGIDDSGASGQSLQSASTTTPCAVPALPAGGTTLPATGFDLLPVGLLSFALLGLGFGLRALGRRSAV